MRYVLQFSLFVSLVSGIASWANLTSLRPPESLWCAFMYLIVGLAFLLPTIKIGWQKKIAILLLFHFVAVVYAEVMENRFNRMQDELVSNAIALAAEPDVAVEATTTETKISSLKIQLQRTDALNSAYMLAMLDFLWLLWLLWEEKSHRESN